MIYKRVLRGAVLALCIWGMAPNAMALPESQPSHFMEEKDIEVSPAFGQKLWGYFQSVHGKFEEGEDSYEFSVIFDKPVSSLEASQMVRSLSPTFLQKGATFKWATSVDLKIKDTSGHASTYNMDGKYWVHQEGGAIYLVEKKKKFKVW